ncbi:MAG: hypothetical protein M3O31_07215, partial [Acidobacteriota bacterium]|nr:hypothetical protein [Acidobacteriota bacterium]
PITTVANSNGRTQATDIALLSVTVVNSTLMTAMVSLNPRAPVSLRAVDVLNFDGTTTAGSAAGGPGTSQPVRVQSSSSLGTPLSVLNLALLHPRDGTVAMLGQELDADAIVSGTGTGTVIGQWVWDGNVVEQFTASIVGGQSTRVRTRQSLPTQYLGVHTLQLRMTQPNMVATRPVTVVVNPGGWKLERLILPEYGAAFSDDGPPGLLWAPVPGAAKYQVGFSTQPYLSTIREWFDVIDNRWRVPRDIWIRLPEGEFFWTVRTIETSGDARKPLPMRRIYRSPAGVLEQLYPTPGQTATGHSLLEWKASLKSGFYFVLISTDAEGTQVVRQYFTSEPRLDLRAIDGKLTPGTTYFWRVDAIAQNGKLIMSGPAQSFVAQSVPKAVLGGRGPARLLVSLGRSRAQPNPQDAAVQMTSRTPAPNATIGDLQPTISADFQAGVNPADVSLMVDGVDITSIARVGDTKVVYTPPLALPAGDHTVNLTVGNEATSWRFTITGAAVTTAPPSPISGTTEPTTDAEAAPPNNGTLPSPAEIVTQHHHSSTDTQARPTYEGQIGSNTQWTSGSHPPDSNVLSVAERVIYANGPWQVDVSGSGIFTSILNPAAQRTSHGRVNDYVLHAGYKGQDWAANLRFGIVAPVLYVDAQYVTAATPRQGAEGTLTTPAGVVGYFVNTNDLALGGGSGITFHQALMGASWQAPLPKWARFRLMWLNARDVGPPTIVAFDSQGNPIIVPNPVAAKSRGDVYGALLNVHFSRGWLWSSEYAFSRENANTADPTSKTQFGRAWRTAVSGQAGNTTVSAMYRDVGPNFGNPANPSLTQTSQPDLRGVDSAITQTTKAGVFGLNYSFLENNVKPVNTPELLLHNISETWSKPFGVKTNLAVQARQSLTQTGTIPAALRLLPLDQQGRQDHRDLSGDISLSRQINTVTMSINGTRDWNRNNLIPAADTITSSISLGTNWATRGFFQLNAQLNVNWVAADKLTVGTSRNLSIYVQPAFLWTRPSLQVSPLLSLNQGQTKLSTGTFTNDTLTGQYGGRICWTLPGVAKFNTLSVQGDYNQNRNNVISQDRRSTELLVLWTATWGHKGTL